MIRYLKYAFLTILAICLVTLALANRGDVTLTLLPPELATLFGFNAVVTLPLFIVILGGLIAGILVGFVWEWFREYKYRSEASTEKRERQKLTREVRRLKKADPAQQDDDVLAILEGGGSTR